MSRHPRWYRANGGYCETQRTADRQFLFKPDENIRKIIGAAAGRALAKYPVKLYWLDFNINHKHDGRDPLSDSPEHLENLAKFDQLFNSLVARGINKYLGREGPLFSTRNRSTPAVDDESLEQQLLYAVTNPVKDGLVDRVAHWKGFSSYKQLATGEVEQFSYINWTKWHRAGGEKSKRAPEEFTEWTGVKLSPIPSWEKLPPHKRQALFRHRVRQLEQRYRAEREKEGRRPMGPRKLAKLDPRQRPRDKQEQRRRQPLCHASTAGAAREYEKQLRVFLDQYYYASSMWLEGVYDVQFPPGSFKPPILGIPR